MISTLEFESDEVRSQYSGSADDRRNTAFGASHRALVPPRTRNDDEPRRQGKGMFLSWHSHVSCKSTISFDMISLIVGFSRILMGRPLPIFQDMILSLEWVTIRLCMIIRPSRVIDAY
jgi:hypothetical protein